MWILSGCAVHETFKAPDNYHHTLAYRRAIGPSYQRYLHLMVAISLQCGSRAAFRRAYVALLPCYCRTRTLLVMSYQEISLRLTQPKSALSAQDLQTKVVVFMSKIPDKLRIVVIVPSLDGNDLSEPEWAYRWVCLLYTSPSPRDQRGSRMPSSA